jgi:hypothetical protein
MLFEKGIKALLARHAGLLLTQLMGFFFRACAQTKI